MYAIPASAGNYAACYADGPDPDYHRFQHCAQAGSSVVLSRSDHDDLRNRSDKPHHNDVLRPHLPDGPCGPVQVWSQARRTV